MLSIILNNWNNPDLQATQGYATSYTLRHGDKRLYRVHLSLQKGFYQMTEFLSPENDGTNFVLEQTNKSGRLKIAVFDKASGAMLGVLKGNTLYDQNEAEVFQLTPLAQAANFALYDLPEAYSDDLVALSSPGGTAVALQGCAIEKQESSNWKDQMSPTHTIRTVTLAGILALLAASPAVAQEKARGNGAERARAGEVQRERPTLQRRGSETLRVPQGDARFDRRNSRDRRSASWEEILRGRDRTGRARVPPGWCIGRGNPHNTPSNCGFLSQPRDDRPRRR